MDIWFTGSSNRNFYPAFWFHISWWYCEHIRHTFLSFKTIAPVHLDVLTSQDGYHRGVTAVYVDDILELMYNIYSMFIEWDVPIRSTQVVTQQIRHAYKVIQSGLQLLPTSPGYKNVCAAPSVTATRTGMPAGFLVAHAALQSHNSNKYTQKTKLQEKAPRTRKQGLNPNPTT